jgi:hypothetical protein
MTHNESVLGKTPKELEKIPNYILYIKTLEQLNETLRGMDNSILGVGETILDLNKTLTRIDDSIRLLASRS